MQKIEKFALNLQLQIIQIMTNNVQMLILCLSYIITTVNKQVNNQILYNFWKEI